jgi:hypothetical protein
VTWFSAGDRRLSLLRRPLSSAFERRVVILAVGGVHPVVQAEWRDALVEIERGTIHLELSDGHWHRVTSGDVLWLHGLPVRALHNRGPVVAVVVALRRRHPPR